MPKQSILVSPAKLRAVADAIERSMTKEVAELRRMADLLDGVAKAAKPRRATVKKVKRKTAKLVRKQGRAKPVKSRRKVAKKRAPAR